MFTRLRVGSQPGSVRSAEDEEQTAASVPMAVPPAIRPAGPEAAVPPTGRRLRSLDAFRGLAIAGMVFVNVPGDGVWPQLGHAKWNGLTAADLVFPAFLVAAGGSLALARSHGPVRIARRVISLLALGLLVNRATWDGPLRYPGVLQRIAVCYLIASGVVRLPRKAVVVVSAALLVGYAVVLRNGGMTATHSLGGRVDIALFGQRHIYHQYRYDPEGLLGSVAATASVLIGYLVVIWLKARPRTLRTAATLSLWATLLVAAGWTIRGYLPLNKRLWTPSYTLVTAGIALLALGVLFSIVEVARTRAAAWPLEVIGANAILVYVTSELGDAGLRRIRTLAGPCAHGACQVVDGHTWIYQHWFTPRAGARAGSLMFSLTFLFVLWLFAALLWRARLLVRV